MNNLSIAVTAHELNPNLFVVARQNDSGNSALFAAYDADFTMVHSQILAQESVAILTAPLLARFLEKLRNGTDRSLPLNAITLLVDRSVEVFLLPDDQFKLIAGDQLLFASPLAAQRNFELTVRNANELD